MSAYPERSFEGKVIRVAPTLDPQTRRVQARVAVDNREGLLKPEMYARVAILADAREELPCVPIGALLVDGVKNYVFVERDPGVFEKREVTRLQTRNHAYVWTGLRPARRWSASAPCCCPPSWRAVRAEGRATMFDTLITLALRQRVFIPRRAAGARLRRLRGQPDLHRGLPDVQDVQVQVSPRPSRPGARGGRERTISLPIEREMSGVPGMTQLRSVSITGLSVVTLTFNEKTADYFARQQVLERLQQVSLPPAPSRPWRPSPPPSARSTAVLEPRPPPAGRTSARCRTGPSARPCAWCRASPRWSASAARSARCRCASTPTGCAVSVSLSDVEPGPRRRQRQRRRAG